MKIRCTSHVLILLTALSLSSASADTIVLKSGERLEGKVLEENATSVVLEYNLTPKIKDKKSINKADIQEMTRLSPAQIEIEERGLRKLVPTADLLTPSDYEAIIQDKLRTFVAKHPNTPESAEVERMIITMSEEKDRVAAGELKVEGKWLDAVSVKQNSYNIEAYRHRLAMNTLAAEVKDERYVNALRKFDLLRTQFPASTYYVAAVPDAIALLDNYEKKLSAMSAEQPILAKKREDGLKLINGPELQITKASIDDEVRAFKATFDVQKKTKVKWTDVYKYDAPSIQAAQLAVSKERAELKALNLAGLKAESETFGNIIRLIAEEKAEEAQAALASIPKETLINKATATAVGKQITALKEELKKKKGQAAVAAATAAAVEAPMDTPAADGGNNIIADSIKKKQMEKESGSADSKDGDAKDKKTDATTNKSEDKKPEVTTPVAEEPEGFLASINAYLPFIGGGLLAVLLIAMFMGKKKKEE
jgi:hypothetical protein